MGWKRKGGRSTLTVRCSQCGAWTAHGESTTLCGRLARARTGASGRLVSDALHTRQYGRRRMCYELGCRVRPLYAPHIASAIPCGVR